MPDRQALFYAQIMEVSTIQLRLADPSYLEFLRNFEPHVPMKRRPYLWPILLDGITYGIPITTQDTGANFPGFLSDGNRGLNMRFMIPLPEQALLPAPKELPLELQTALEYYERSRSYITAESKLLYDLSKSKQMEASWMRHSCDFQELNSVFSDWKPGFEPGLFLNPKKEVEDMPVSKSGKAYYTKEQYEQAKYNSNAYEYARAQGYDLVQQGSHYTMREHDSMVFAPNGSWFWNSRGVHGSALEFQMYYEGKTIVDAVLTLCGERQAERTVSAPLPQKAAAKETQERTASEFRLPGKAANYKTLFAYLCSERSLSKPVVQELIGQGLVYQSNFLIQGRYPVSNAVFVYRNDQGKAVGAFNRGMTAKPGQEPYKRDAPGSDKRWGWLLKAPDVQAAQVRVFEGAIDAASDATLSQKRMGDAWRTEPVDRLSLEGLGMQPLENYLKSHPNVRDICLMLDADEPGREASKRISDKLRAMGYAPEDRLPAMGLNDWNEVAQQTAAIEQEQNDRSEPEEPELE